MPLPIRSTILCVAKNDGSLDVFESPLPGQLSVNDVPEQVVNGATDEGRAVFACLAVYLPASHRCCFLRWMKLSMLRQTNSQPQAPAFVNNLSASL
jgi:hypothetical protein